MYVLIPTLFPSIIRQYMQRIGLPYVYGYPIVFGKVKLGSFAMAREENPTLRQHLRSLQFYRKSWMSATQFTSAIRECTLRMLKDAPNLRLICAIEGLGKIPPMVRARSNLSLDWPAFEALANTAGATLLSILDVNLVGNPTHLRSPFIFHRFSALRSISCTTDLEFLLDSDKILSDSLPNLASITLQRCHPSILDVLSQMEYVLFFHFASR
jgi:hypothetical protein